jgi:IS30 family transposase
VRATEVRVEPEVNGQLLSIVRTGDVLARLSAVKLTAQADQARAALASATANRNNVYAGVRREQVDALKAAIAKAGARLDYVQAQLTRTSTLARQSFESQQSLDQAENDAASARADVSEAQANYDAAGNVRSPTRRCRQRPPQSPCSSAGLTRWCCVLPRTASSPSSPQRSTRMTECPLCAAGSIGQRNTLIFYQRWSVDMKQRRRIYYSAAQRSEIWDRWRAGEPMSSIGRRFDRESSSVFSVISPTGGIRPPDRCRAKQVLSLSEREEISRWLSRRCSLRSIARHLGRSPSTISREVQRNGGADRYRAAGSDQAAWDRARRPKLCKLACRPFLRRTVSTLLRRQWSPEQIAGWLKRTYPVEPQKQVSHETIYRSLFIQARGVLKKELLEHLRARRTVRRSRHASMKRNGLGQIKNAVSISERPSSVEDRAVPGHWEGDLIGGSRNSYIATLVERHSRYVMLVKVANKDTESVVSALIKQSQRLPGELYRSLTWDRGKELADHQRLTLATEVDIYFCDPRSPWQRGSNENTNRLLRQYLPRGTDLSLHSQAKLSAIARQLNERPRKTLLYQTPAEKFAECVAAIG